MRKKLGAGAGPTRAIVEHSREIGYVLHRSFHLEPDPWAKWLGYDLYRTKDLPSYVPGVLKRGRIYLHDGLGAVDEILAIAHEHTHDRFHPDCVAYAELDLFDIDLQEMQADGGAAVALYPDLSAFETEDQFRSESVMARSFTELRLAIRRKYGV